MMEINSEMIRSDAMSDAMTVVDAILTVWDLEHGKNSIRTG